SPFVRLASRAGRRRHRLSTRHCRGAGIGSRDADQGRSEERILLDAKTFQREKSHQDNDNGDDDGDDGPANKKIGHGLFALRFLGLSLSLRSRRGPVRRAFLLHLYDLRHYFYARLYLLKALDDDLLPSLDSRIHDPP